MIGDNEALSADASLLDASPVNAIGKNKKQQADATGDNGASSANASLVPLADIPLADVIEDNGE